MLALLVTVAMASSAILDDANITDIKVGVPLQFEENMRNITTVLENEPDTRVANTTTDDQDIPRRVDVRCRYQKVRWRPSENDYIIYKIFMNPHEKLFPRWCENIESVIRSQCRTSTGEYLLPPDAIRWQRCDVDSTDDVDGWRGYTASFELRQWDKEKFGKANDRHNVNCILNAINWAADGSIVDYFYEDKCFQIKRARYRLSY
jgi:hypothetical protein